MIRSAFLRTLLALAVLAATTATVAAAPNQQPAFEVACSDGQSILINPGALSGKGAAAFVVGTNQVAVAKKLVITLDGQPVVSWAPGFNGFGEDDLLFCSGALGGGFVISVWTFLTPRG